MEIIQGPAISFLKALAHLATKHIIYFLNQWVLKFMTGTGIGLQGGNKSDPQSSM